MGRKKKRKQTGARRLPARLRQELDRIQRLMERGDLEEARRRLHPLEERYPQYPDVWDMMVALYPRDPVVVLRASERLLDLNADDDVSAYNRIVTSLQLFGPFLPYEWGQEFLRKWPNSSLASKIDKLVEALPNSIDKSIARVRQDFPHLSVEQAREVMRLHELVRYYMALQRYEDAVAAAEALLRIEPRFAPAVNNLATIYTAQRKYEDALQMLTQAYENGVKNAYTLAMLVELLYMLGRDEDVQKFAAELETTPPETLDQGYQKMVAWALLGEDERVLKAFEEAKATGEFEYDPTGLVGEVYHLAAAAHMRLGREREARRLWEQALQQENRKARICLDDFLLPPEKRHIPWYFDMYGLPAFFHESEMKALEETLKKKGEALKRALRQQMEAHPHLPRLFAVWLDRGAPDARTLAFRLLTVLDDPQYYPILAEFGQSTHGPDALRMEAIKFLLHRRYFSGPSVRVWQSGEWRTVSPELIEVEIVDIPEEKDSWDLQVLTEEGTIAMTQREFRRAELLFRTALRMMPEDTSTRHNLAIVLLYQDHREEALALLKELRREHPEYIFARTTLAGLALADGDIEQAKAWLGDLHEEPLRKKKRWHVTEYVAFIKAVALVTAAMGETENALHLLDSLRDMLASDFDRPNLEEQVWLLQRRIRSGRSAVDIAKEMVSPHPSEDAERLALLEGTPLRIGQRVRVLSDTGADDGGRGRRVKRTGWLLDVKPGRSGRPPKVRVAWDAATMKRLGIRPKELNFEEQEPYKRGKWVLMEAVEPVEKEGE